MREILFKAKRTDNGEWVQGYYVKCKKEKTNFNSVIFTDIDCAYPENFEFYEIDENTLCQYTGLTDKNGNKIWENDVVLIVTKDYIESTEKAIVEYHAPKYMLKTIGKYANLRDIKYEGKDIDMGATHRFRYEYEVIGNIFDNKELLETT